MFVCSDCGHESLTWKGQCDMCQAWSTLKEFKEVKTKTGKNSPRATAGELQSIHSMLEHKSEERINTSSKELNTVLGGGIIQGGITLLSGEPGIGKSTLALQLANWIESEIIYISGEETLAQVSSRAKRLQITGKNMSFLSESNIENVLATLQKSDAQVVILDSISVMYSDELSGASGSIGQVRYITEKVVEYGKKNNISFIIIGHVTKDGALAGPKTLEHMVDTLLYFEGDKYDNLRILRCLKNRFGSSSEIGLYNMTDTGLHDIENPGKECISSEEASIGSALGVTIEGSRPLIVETEALTTYTKFGYPKRSSRGIISSKLDLIIAVLGKYTKIRLDSYDVYANITRGLSIAEPGLDLAIAASIISSKQGKKLGKDVIFIGEISLTGKIKTVMNTLKRIKEAEKLGISRVYTAKGSDIGDVKKIQIIEIDHISQLTENIT